MLLQAAGPKAPSMTRIPTLGPKAYPEILFMIEILREIMQPNMAKPQEFLQYSIYWAMQGFYHQQ